MPQKVFITGSNGQLGRELKKQLDQLGINSVGYDLPELDITNLDSTQTLINKENPDVIINCAALTNVDGCEVNIDDAYAINETGPKNLAIIAKERDIPLVQVSTDYVFDGNGISENGKVRPYLETDQINPQSVYGKSKAKGEEAVQKLLDKYYIIRTAWLYGDGHNFVKTMLKLSDNHDTLTVVDDQVGSPTSTKDLAKAIIDLIQTDNYGIYHGTCQDICSWADFAKEIFSLTNKPTEVIGVSSEEYAKNAPQQVANRPAYSVLENKHLQDINLDSFRNWKTALKDYLKELDFNNL